MNALTASTLVAVISAIALAIVALITARSRIGILPKKAEHNLSGTPGIQIDLPESAAKFRVLGWLVVVTMYLIAVFCLLQGKIPAWAEYATTRLVSPVGIAPS